jgi:hypothetical protein
MTPKTLKEFIATLFAMYVLMVSFILLDVQTFPFVLELLVQLMKFGAMFLMLLPLL